MFLFHYPFLNSHSYNRVKLKNFKDTFSNLNVDFNFFNDKKELKSFLNSKDIKIIYTSFHSHYLNKIDFKLIKSSNSKIKILIDLPPWENPISSTNYTDVMELKNNTALPLLGFAIILRLGKFVSPPVKLSFK